MTLLPFFPPGLIPSGAAGFSSQLWEFTVQNQQSFNWTVPSGVEEISAAAIGCGGNGGPSLTSYYAAGGGGGALSYSNGIQVTPGETLTITQALDGGTWLVGIKRGSVWILRAESGFTGAYRPDSEPISGAFGGRAERGIGDVCHSGGHAGVGTSQNLTMSPSGGGAAGYSGKGGNAGSAGGIMGGGGPAESGIGGGGGGGYDGQPNSPVKGGYGGGGTGIEIKGANGAAGVSPNQGGTPSGRGGSYGGDGNNRNGGDYGGGGGGGYNDGWDGYGLGGKGAVRIIYNGGAYPNNSTPDTYDDPIVPEVEPFSLNGSWETGMDGWNTVSGSPSRSSGYGRTGSYGILQPTFGGGYQIAYPLPEDIVGLQINMSVWHKAFYSFYSGTRRIGYRTNGGTITWVASVNDLNTQWAQFSGNFIPQAGNTYEIIIEVSQYYGMVDDWVIEGVEPS